MAMAGLVEEKGLEGVVENSVNGFGTGLADVANLMVYAGGAALAGYFIGDLLPEAFNYLRSTLGAPEAVIGISINIPRGFGIPSALAVPEQLIFGHDYAKGISMAYLAAAPVVAKYVGEKIVAPLVKPLVDVVRSR